MMLLDPLLACFACVFIIIALVVTLMLVRRFKKAASAPIPGPPSTDLLKGNIPEMLTAGSLYQYVSRLHERYGPVVSFVWSRCRVVSVCDHLLWKDSISRIFDRPPEMFKFLEPMVGSKSIQFCNGELGRRLHGLYERSFTSQAVRSYYQIFIQAGHKMADKWSLLPSDEHIPVHANMMITTMRSISRAGMGRIFNDEKEVANFCTAFDTCMNELGSSMTGPPDAPVPDESKSHSEKFFEARQTLLDIVRSTLAQRREEHERGTPGDLLFIDSIIDCDFIDQERMESDTLSFFFAGSFTTGNMITWCFYHLALHPEIQEKVYQELVSVLGDEVIDPKGASKLKYCRQVLDETIRCSVPCLWGARVDYEQDVQIGQYVVPKGTPILTPFGVALNNQQLYPEPQRFDPERFSPDATKHRPPLAFAPFGFAGKRKCPGWRFSIEEGLVMLSIFMRRFRIRLVEGQTVEPTYIGVTAPKDEIWITVEKR